MRSEIFHKQNQEKQDAIIAAGMGEFSRKSYSDASTDAIVQSCGISKGLLFHYFGSKREFYIYCLSQSLEKLMKKTEIPKGDFYEILFSVMDEKLKLCAQYPVETLFVNMASRETASEVAKSKAEVFMKYAAQKQAEAAVTMERALATLSLKVPKYDKAKEGLLLYSNAIVSKYLISYQNSPDEFFKNAEMIKQEMKEYMELMLYGIVCTE